jgi:hypothetical protein
MDFKPSAGVQAQIQDHEKAISYESNKNMTALERSLAREANLERNGFPKLQNAFAKIYSAAETSYPTNGGINDIQFKDDERCVGEALYTPWTTLPGIDSDPEGLVPNFRYLRVDAVKGPLGSHSTRPINEIHVRWVKDEFVSTHETVVSFSNSNQVLFLPDKNLKLDLGRELSSEELNTYADILESLITPFAEQVVTQQ